MDTERISDADREEAVNLLGEQYAVGRLTKEEYDERSDAAWSARTQGDLAPLFADLPMRASTPPARTSRSPRQGRRSIPVLPLVLVLIALTVLAKAPILLIALCCYFLLRWGPGISRGARRHHR